MAFRDASKIKCFNLWKSGASLKHIEQQVTAKPESVRDWVLQWERGKQGIWEPKIKRH